MIRRVWYVVGLAGLGAMAAALMKAPVAAEAPSGPTKGILAPDRKEQEAARLFAQRFPRGHLRRLELDVSVATNAIEIYLSTLDFDRSYFLASDVQSFRARAPQAAEALRAGELQLAFDIFEVFRARVRDRVAYVDRLLAEGFDVDRDESYLWKRRDAPWPEGPAEWNELWRKKIKNEYVARLVARKLAEETQADKAGGVTNGVAEESLAPEAFIRKRYEQYLTILEDYDAESVVQRYLSAFAQVYDPHSDYMTRDGTEDFDIGMKLSLMGIGALLSAEDGMAKVERIIPGGPADRDGRLKAGDRIVAVAEGDGPPVSILHWPLHKAVQAIRGAKGTRVVLTVVPASDISGAITVKIDLIRDEVQLEEQAAKGRIEEIEAAPGRTNRLGVVSLPAFYVDIRNRINEPKGEFRSSSRDVARLLTELQAQGAEGMVLDLRNNGGGSLTEAVEMTGLFFESGPVVQVKERRGIQVLGDADPAVVYGGPLVVLVNRQSASASEILAGALQDYGRAVIVGDAKTHGKGTVQSLVALDDKRPEMGSIKVTTASFHRIAGGSTQLRGVTPDIVVSSLLDALEIGEEYLPHAMAWTVVGRALYRPTAQVTQWIPELRERSLARRRADPRFVAHEEMVQRLAERHRSREMSLRLADRLELARIERRLGAAEEHETGEEPGPPERSKDLAMEEALRILCDLIDLSQGRSSTNGNSVLEDARGR